jgi:hypothetical protein
VVVGIGPIMAVDDVTHLGLPDEVDIDAFEFVGAEMPNMPGQPMLAVLFSVDDDDPLTPTNESAGLNPGAIYISWMTGFFIDFTDPIGDDIDALTVWFNSLEQGACCYGNPPIACVVTDQDTCNFRYRGVWYGPGTNCMDADGNAVADVCAGIGACCYGGAAPVLCAMTTQSDCQITYGGLWHGTGTSCFDYDGDGVPDICQGPVWCYGDSNCSGGAPTFPDIPFFVASLNGQAAWAAYHVAQTGSPPACPYGVNDIDGGGVGFTDIQPFVQLLGQPCRPYP